VRREPADADIDVVEAAEVGAQAKVDVIDEWAEVDLAYDLPPMAKLPAEGAGTKPAGGDEGGPTVKPSAVRRSK